MCDWDGCSKLHCNRCEGLRMEDTLPDCNFDIFLRFEYRLSFKNEDANGTFFTQRIEPNHTFWFF